MAFPVTMSYPSVSPEARQAAGITDKTIRLSIGIEHRDDLGGPVAGARKLTALGRKPGRIPGPIRQIAGELPSIFLGGRRESR
jgi:cystathionine gamma-synthase